MRKGLVIVALAVLITGGVGWFLYNQAREDAQTANILAGFPSGSPSPTPLSSVGDLAMLDPKRIVDPSSNPGLAEAPLPVRVLEGGVKVQDIKVGVGESVQLGAKVKIRYVGKLLDGTVFDSSENHGGSFRFTLGAGTVIRGWDIGVVGMRVGGKRSLLIPSALGYGQRGWSGGGVPPNAPLLFDLELIAVESDGKNP